MLRACSDFVLDLRHAVRGFTQAPGFTLTVLAALALGIGANTALFTVVDTVLLHALPFPHADRIVNVASAGGSSINEPEFGFLEQSDSGLEDLAAYQSGASMNLNGGDRPELVEAIAASRTYFALFGAHPVAGRTFTAAEDSAGGPRALVLSYGLWQRGFGGDPSILGRTIALGGASYPVVGVLAPDFKPYPPADVWVPLQADANSTKIAGVLTVCGRRSAGLSLTQADSRIAAIGRRYGQTRPTFKGDPRLHVRPLEQMMTGEIRPALLILLGAVGLVLLIACANVANLLLARASGRQREIAIRAAIGAGSGRLVRQLLAESMLLSLAGGALGLALGSWGVRALLAFTPGDLPRIQEMASTLDPRVALFTLALAAGTGILCGLLPAAQAARPELASALQESSGRTGTGRTQNRTRAALVAAEVALAVVLLCGATLLLRSFAAMHTESLGFDPRHLLTMEISLAGSGYAKSSDVDRMARQFVERAERIPGVESAALASALPLFGKMDMIFNIPGRTPPAGSRIMGDVQWRFVTPHYFDAMRIPLLAGRLPRDREPGRTVVISQALARRFWPGANPVGQTLFIGPDLGPVYQVGITEIVGVVGDVRERLEFEAGPVMYQAPSQIPDGDMALLNGYEPGAILIRMRPGVAPSSVSRAVQDALEAGGQLAAAKVRTMEQAGFDSTARQNFNLLLLGGFAALALLLAAVGIYGVMSYSVEQRTHEIGIRAALGADRRDTLALVLGQAFRVALAGAAIGIAASFGLTRLLRAQLFGVTPSDPLTFATVPLILLAVALSAAAIPALRASRVDPVVALRHE